jgi:hypothetical protein
VQKDLGTKHKPRIVKVFVRSKRVAVSSIIVPVPDLSIIAHTTLLERTGVLYEDQLEETQKLMVQYARDLAGQAGLSVEIVDLSKLGIFERLLNSTFKKFPGAPAIFLPDSVFSQIMKNVPVSDSIKSMKDIPNSNRVDGPNISRLLPKIN